MKLKVGDPVTVYLSDRYSTVIARVTKVCGRGMYAQAARRPAQVHYLKREEGITWCRGHNGKVVDAFRVTRALR